MPTIVQINVTANWGSSGTIAENIGRIVIEKGWRSIIAYGRQSKQSNSEVIKIGGTYDFCCHIAGTRLFDKHGLMSTKATQKFVTQLESIKPDIVHLHNIHGYYLNYPILFEYLNRTKIPVVWTLHDCWAFTGHCGHFIHENCERWKTLCHECPLKQRYPKSWWTDRSEKNHILKKKIFSRIENLHIVTVSQWLANMTQQSFLGIHPIQCIYNGIDINTYKYRDCKEEIFHKLRIPKGSHIVLGVSNVWPDSKGFPDYLKLRAELDANYVIVLVGLDKKKIRSLPHGIIGLERTNSVSELVDLYSSADAVLSLSTAETFGLTIAEGMACGTPGIVYNNTSQPELITNETGAVVEQGDITGLVNTIISICNHKNSFFFSTCRSRIVHYFNKNEQYKKYLSLYESLILPN